MATTRRTGGAGFPSVIIHLLLLTAGLVAESTSRIARNPTPGSPDQTLALPRNPNSRRGAATSLAEEPPTAPRPRREDRIRPPADLLAPSPPQANHPTSPAAVVVAPSPTGRVLSPMVAVRRATAVGTDAGRGCGMPRPSARRQMARPDRGSHHESPRAAHPDLGSPNSGSRGVHLIHPS